MLFTNNTITNPLDIMYQGQRLEVKDKCTFLGVTLDNKLKFNHHISNIGNKISKSIGVLFKLQNSVPKLILTNLYHTLIHPYLYYCNITWAHTYQIHTNPLIVYQKRAVRILCQAPFLAHTNHLFNNCNILKFHDLKIYCTSIYMFKNLTNFETLDNHGHNTRNRQNLRVPAQRTKTTQQSITFVGPKTWNNLPANLISLNKLSTFKKHLKIHLLAKYNSPT